jgi:hypothetical protein
VTFKAQAIADLSTFLNVDEFADSVVFDGIGRVACVFDGEGDTQASREGVINQDLVLHVRVSDFPSAPFVGQRVVIQDKPADVIAVDEQHGMYVVRTRWFDS